MLNPDGFTTLFNPTEFPETQPGPPALRYIPGHLATGGDLTATLNPFVAYNRDAPRCMFEAGSVETRTVRLRLPPGPIEFGYAIDVSWQLVEDVTDPLTDFPPDANCLESYQIDVQVDGALQEDLDSQAIINVEVFDHQGIDTISTVTVEAPDIFNGTISLDFSTTTGQESWLFTGIISNDFGAVRGTYPLLVRVTDTQSDQNLGVVDAWQLYDLKVKIGWARTWGGCLYGPCRADSVAIDNDGGI